MKKSAEKSFAPHDFREPRIFLFLLATVLIAVLLFYCITSLVTSVGYQAFAEAEHPAGLLAGETSAFTIILDAGHGGEDPGAVANGLDEKVLNLSITNKIAEFLKLSGYNVVLTRSDDRLLYNSGEETRKKYYDLYNRLKIAEAYSDAIFISIHMNKFPMESCQGLQTFYSMNDPRSAMLAEALQSSSTLVMPDNRRTIKSDNRTIFLLKNLQIPAVIVECGFLSNSQDAHNLADAEYQDKLAFALAAGIGQYCEKMQEEMIH
ncbi:MAG: N-acetylmuramoyl-L-alanine amidase [Oscillospiraceae bacterium]|nr:N-acetylmuramoyl-L-alanine amidase [Oscillospiraceae bacterium]